MLATGPSMLPSRNADRTARPPGGHGAPLPTMAPAA